MVQLQHGSSPALSYIILRTKFIYFWASTVFVVVTTTKLNILQTLDLKIFLSSENKIRNTYYLLMCEKAQIHHSLETETRTASKLSRHKNDGAHRQKGTEKKQFQRKMHFLEDDRIYLFFFFLRLSH